MCAGSSLNNLIGTHEHGLWNRHAERLRGLEIDDELEPRRLLDGEIARLGALEDLDDITGGLSIDFRLVRGIADEPACFDLPPEGIHARQLMLRGEVGNLCALCPEQRPRVLDDEGLDAVLLHCVERAWKVSGCPHRKMPNLQTQHRPNLLDFAAKLFRCQP